MGRTVLPKIIYTLHDDQGRLKSTKVTKDMLALEAKIGDKIGTYALQRVEAVGLQTDDTENKQ